MTTMLEMCEELDRRQVDIPFGNSAFQTAHFIVATQEGQARQYRAALLQANEKRRALEEEQHRLALEDIDIEEMQEKLAEGNLDKFEKKRTELKLARKIEARAYGEKLIKDAIVELEVLFSIIAQHPTYTRQEFEALEAQHYTQHLMKQINKQDGAQSDLLALTRNDVIGVSPVVAIDHAAQRVDLLEVQK